MQVMPATSDSNFGPADAIRNDFNFRNEYNHSEPNSTGGAQKPRFCTLFTADTQLEMNMGDAS